MPLIVLPLCLFVGFMDLSQSGNFQVFKALVGVKGDWTMILRHMALSSPDMTQCVTIWTVPNKFI